ncbi:oxygenase MpaB family protein [Nitriliruptor alkaliphilus]|uniref:oxygenase MpaB family protein n=1 Tax=Nitriliruptor alkaliphilus TaxID=427918 RepID=UPI000AC0CA44|nr:oxygenase MpaB family protein [Nitriliruptor alkaliphilus]
MSLSLSRRSAGLPGVGAVVRRQLARTFGPAPFDPAADPGDPGVTGPGSSSWRVIAEPAAIAGGIRGLLLQVAHPLAMAGVHDHSAFREDPLGRLQRTSGYVTGSVFGSTREAIEFAEVVRRVHPHVRGVAPDGRPYRADDPHLLAWVGIALTSSFLTAHRVWAPTQLTAAEEDRFILEQSRIAALLDPRVDLADLRVDTAATSVAIREGSLSLPMVEDGTLPRSVAELDAILDAYAPELGVNHQGREALRFLRWPPLPAPVRAGYLTLFGGAVGSLQPRERRALDITLRRPAPGLAVEGAGAALAVMRIATGTSPSVQLAGARAAA